MYFVCYCGAGKSSCCHGTLNKVFDSQSGGYFNIKCDTSRLGADAAGQKELRGMPFQGYQYFIHKTFDVL